MTVFDELIQKKTKLSVIGLGYVGLPIAVAFAKKIQVIGFDLNINKIKQYTDGRDLTGEVGDRELQETEAVFTSEARMLEQARFHIIAVPTPINLDKTPNLNPVRNASELVGNHLSPGSIVVYESTVYPGVTEDICIPILERQSGLKCGADFFVGYSPERINPGDNVHRLDNIIKVVSGMNSATLDQVAKVYELIIEAGVHRVSSIKTAEASKVVENSQRDINIAFMNEMAMVFERMGIDTMEVLEAMGTKWNALRFTPGLVGGHCIGVDPYYFIYQAEKLGFHSQIISSGRKINDDMGKYIAEITIKKFALAGKLVKEARVAVMGITFKENCNDIRNSKVIDIIRHLKEYEIEPVVSDLWADKEEVLKEYGIKLIPQEEIRNMDCVIFAVAHDSYKAISEEELAMLFKPSEKKIIIDVKAIFDKNEMLLKKYVYWRL